MCSYRDRTSSRWLQNPPGAGFSHRATNRANRRRVGGGYLFWPCRPVGRQPGVRTRMVDARRRAQRWLSSGPVRPLVRRAPRCPLRSPARIAPSAADRAQRRCRMAQARSADKVFHRVPAAPAAPRAFLQVGACQAFHGVSGCIRISVPLACLSGNEPPWVPRLLSGEGIRRETREMIHPLSPPASEPIVAIQPPSA
jgi:hypothetical protein